MPVVVVVVGAAAALLLAPPLLALAVPDKRRRAAVYDFLCARLSSLEASTEYDGRGAFIAVVQKE